MRNCVHATEWLICVYLWLGLEFFKDIVSAAMEVASAVAEEKKEDVMSATNRWTPLIGGWEKMQSTASLLPIPSGTAPPAVVIVSLRWWVEIITINNYSQQGYFAVGTV